MKTPLDALAELVVKDGVGVRRLTDAAPRPRDE